MPDTALDIIRAAAAHPLLGQESVLDRAATGGSTTSLIDAGLITFANDQRYQGYWLYVWSGTNAGTERFVSGSDLSTGTLTWGNAYGGAVANGDGYLAFRDARWSQWLDWLNDSARNLYFDREVYTRGVTDQMRYSLPTPFSHSQWVEHVYKGVYPFRWTNRQMPSLDWYQLHPLNIQGDIALVLEHAISAQEQLLFAGRVPYLQQHLSAFTLSRSILTPFGETEGVSAPRDLLIHGVVWRALTQKAATATGANKNYWAGQLQSLALSYAEKLAQNGVRMAGRAVGYGDRN